MPSYPEIRLWPDARAALYPNTDEEVPANDYSSKRVLGREGDSVTFAGADAGLRALLFLGTEPAVGDISILDLPASDAHVRLVELMLRMGPPATAAARSEFGAVSTLVEKMPCYDLSFVRDHAMLDELVSRVVENVGS